MYIKSIVLDGFKSYGNRVEITGFDPEFNAITGLNGTGKSNILDSICFVLGITNLSNVRAGSLQELIYKQGQAGITKATVSITFDNSNRAQQPIGYDSREITVTRQVVMGGKNKYLINGNNVQNKRVSDLFCSVQLNVNNPHFLIMQGRITKVLNMKPPEILSMVEEAAGTRMYEAKKQSSQKIIEKKDAKLRELNAILTEDVAPKLSKLQEERSQFQEYQKVVRELESLNKLYTAWKYVTTEEKTKEADGKVQTVKNSIKAKKDSIKDSEKEIKNIDKEIADMNKALDEESGSVLKELESELVQLEKSEAGSGAAVKAGREAAESHNKRARMLERALKDDAAALRDKEQQLEQVSATFEGLRAASEAADLALTEAQQRFLAVSTGQENASESLQDQLMAAKKEASEAATRVSAASMELKHLEQRLRTLQEEFRAGATQFSRDRSAITDHQKQIDNIQAQLAKMNFDSERNSALRESVRALQGGVRAARDTHDALSARLQRCNFQYTPPPGFDRACVSGTVCRLFEVQDPLYCTALETAAGGKLYNVVVDTEVTSKLLLQRGKLQSRTTIIPLNKITSNVIDTNTVRVAQEIGGGPDNVQLALDLISFPAHLRPAMAWVFGGTLVCRDLETAKRVTFHPRVRRRCVTWDGDVFDPQGTLSGGARQQGGSVLAQLAELREAEGTLAAREAALARDTQALQHDQRTFDDYHALHQRYEIKCHELEVVKSRLATTSHAQLHAEIESLEKQVKELTEAVERDKLLQKEAAARASALENKVKDIKGHREREFKKAEQELKRAKKSAEEHGKKWKEREQELEALKLETRELQRAVELGAAQQDGETAAAQDMRAKLRDLEQEHKEHVEATKQMRTRIERQKEEISSRSGAVRKRLARKENLARAAREAALEAEKLALDITELQTEAERCQKEITSLEREHPWILSEREYFGAAGGLYDFEERGAAAAGARVRSLTAHRDSLARGLNARAHTLLQLQEEQYADIIRKKRIVEADRAKLVQVIAELDEKKRTTLVAACAQVNKDFGSMFSTLLPGAQAKLQPPSGQEVLDGLEVRVGFNGAWKESLGELSGGQRSLVALSLVLAMLLFKPAPLYILDEVDAALDLSHTQNIGLMLKTHFKHSQFIIVSLKDGMFNNANVLFRTRFVDGMSSVQRTVNTKR